MHITKYLHSCLLVEEQGKTMLIDPGNFTYNAHVFAVDKLEKLDYILITHEHEDHFYLPFVKEILQRFPDVTIITNPSIVAILEKEGITAASEENEDVKLDVIAHEKLWDKEPPQNAVFKIFGKLVHPGDSLHFTTTGDILALPLQAPWGSTTQAVEKALEMQPKVIIPIHDWHWKDEVREAMYDRLTGFFKEKEIEFKNVKTGETVEI